MKRLLVTPEFKLFAVAGTMVLLIGALAQYDASKQAKKPVTNPSSISETAAQKVANPS